ncbi:MAG: hypothetical protein ACYDC1_00315 [Limisphaerales bacterium]
MQLENLTSADLKDLVELVEQKEALAAQIARINAQLDAFGGAKPTAVKAMAPVSAPRKTTKRQPRGQLKAAILALLKGTGSKGLAVSEIAAKVGLASKAVFAWFYRTGKSIKQIKKVGEARYAWLG